MWDLSKKNTKKKRVKKRNTSFYNVLHHNSSVNISSITVIKDNAITLRFKMRRFIIFNYVKHTTKTRNHKISFFNWNFSMSQITKILNTENMKSESLEFSELHLFKLTCQLKQIADLRAHSISNYINISQLVVCNNQFVNKSSVLKELTDLFFLNKMMSVSSLSLKSFCNIL